MRFSILSGDVERPVNADRDAWAMGTRWKTSRLSQPHPILMLEQFLSFSSAACISLYFVLSKLLSRHETLRSLNVKL